MKIELILLAGGDSKRFAAKSNESGGKKLLAQFKCKPLFEYALKAAEAFKHFGKVTVVTGEESIRLAAQEKGFRTVCPPPPTEGIAASVRTGTAAADEDAHLCFMVCDQPYFTGEMLKDFISAYLISGKTLGRVRCGKQMGSPTVFAPVHRQALLSAKGDEGGRSIFKRFQGDIFFFDVPEKALKDIDTAEDFE